MAIQVILTQNVPHVGVLGDEVQVKNGFARNYLLPRGMAIVASTRNAAQLKHRRRQLEKFRLEAIQAAQLESGKVGALELEIKAKAGSGGRLFGSVTNRDIQAALAAQGYELDRKGITLHEPIKTLGSFGVTIKLHTEVKVELNIQVVPDGELVAPEPTEASEEAAAEGAAAAEGSESADTAGTVAAGNAQADAAAPAEESGAAKAEGAEA